MSSDYRGPFGRAGSGDATRRFVWRSPPQQPLDQGGPIDRPYTQMGDGFADESVIDHLDKITTQFPDKLAISDGEFHLTYAELRLAVSNVAQSMAAVVPTGCAVGLLLGNSGWYPVAMLASMACGRPCIQLNPHDPLQRIAGIIEEACLPAIVTVDATEAAARTQFVDLAWIDVASTLGRATSAPSLVTETTVSVDSPAVILFTSGSTGRPKGIVNSQRSLLQRVQQYVDASHINADDVFMPLSGAATIAGCREILAALLTGATLHIVDVEAAGLRRIRRQFREFGVTIAYIVPALLRALATQGDADDFASLRVVRIGGEKVLWTDIDLIRSVVSRDCFIQVSYLATETTGSQWFLPHDVHQSGATTPIGWILPGIDFAIVDDDGWPVPDGESGELLVKSMFVALGHWENGRVVPIEADPFDPRRRIFPTGDLAKIDPDGLLHIVGRKGRQLKINGKRIEPAELELVLRRARHVADAVAMASEANELIAFATSTDGAGETFITELRETVRRSLPGVLHPTRLHRLDRIPRLSGGKVDYATLRDLDRSMSSTVSSPSRGELAGSTGIERLVEQVWRDILGTHSVCGCWDDAGGDSLKLLQCVMELEALVGRELSLGAFTVDMTAADMVAVIASTQDHAVAPSTVSNALPPMFMLPGSVGYGPSLAKFGAEMGDVVRVISIRYPDLGGMLRDQNSIAAMADAALRQIASAQPEGDIRLLGYSLGGGVAFEVASRLIAAGRLVRFFGVLDTSIDGTHNLYGETIARTIQRLRSHRVTIYRMSCRAVAKYMVRFGWEARFGALVDRDWHGHLAATRFMLKLELEEVLRMRAFQRWVGEPKAKLPIAGTLFRCQRGEMSPDLGWLALFDQLEIVPISGGHLDLVIEPHLAHNRPLIADALIASTHST